MKRKAKIFYVAMDDFWRKEEKLAWLRENPISKIAFESIVPDGKHNWINQTDNDFEMLVPLINKDVRAGKNEAAIFRLFSLGVATNRDDWVYDFSAAHLLNRMSSFAAVYNGFLATKRADFPPDIKWSRDLKRKFEQNTKIEFDQSQITKALYRPFVYKYFFTNKVTADVLTQNHYLLFGKRLTDDNPCIGIIGKDTIIPFTALALNRVNDLNGLSNAAGGTKTLPLKTFGLDGIRNDNITDWAVEEFARRGADGLSKEDIFHYVYAVLHYPPYREKYAQNLKREFPRIPVYENARAWVEIGKKLMELHLNYETVEPYPLGTSVPPAVAGGLTRPPRTPNLFDAGLQPPATAGGTDPFIPKPVTKLRADKIDGVIEIDSHTRLTGVPAIAWEYKLGNRSAIEWVLDQYKERKPKDPTIAEKFNTYKFADYKGHVIDLIKRVCTVSVETMEIIASMPAMEE